MSDVTESIVRDGLAKALKYESDSDAIFWLTEAVGSLLASHLRLEERLETYIKRSAPAMSAARMQIPIGGGDTFWRRQQAKRQAEQREKVRLRLEELKEQRELVDEFSKLFDLDAVDALIKMPDGTPRAPVKKVQRKRTKKSRRK